MTELEKVRNIMAKGVCSDYHCDGTLTPDGTILCPFTYNECAGVNRRGTLEEICEHLCNRYLKRYAKRKSKIEAWKNL